MSQTYKLNHIEGEEIKHIYIFSSDQSVIEPDYVDSNGNPIFTADEMKNIQDNNIPVDIISSTQLHGDDTIGMIKKKIISALQFELSTKELYLFGITSNFFCCSTTFCFKSKYSSINCIVVINKSLFSPMLPNLSCNSKYFLSKKFVNLCKDSSCPSSHESR